MDSKFIGIVKETIESQAGKPAVVTVEFVVDTDDINNANLVLDGIKDFVNNTNVEYNKETSKLYEGARMASYIKYE